MAFKNDIYDISDFILFYESVENDRRVTNFRMQKILYFIQAKFVKETNNFCFNESLVPWKYGPVVPKIYRRYRGYGGLSISTSHYCNLAQSRSKIEKVEFIEEILEQLKHFSTNELSEIVRCQKPWCEATEHDSDITLSLMRNSFGRINIS